MLVRPPPGGSLIGRIDVVIDAADGHCVRGRHCRRLTAPGGGSSLARTLGPAPPMRACAALCTPAPYVRDLESAQRIALCSLSMTTSGGSCGFGTNAAARC